MLGFIQNAPFDGFMWKESYSGMHFLKNKTAVKQRV